MDLVIKFRTMQQPSSDLSSNQRYIHRTIGIESNFFIVATSITVFAIIINCHLAFKLDHQVLRQCSNLSSLNSLGLALSER